MNLKIDPRLSKILAKLGRYKYFFIFGINIIILILCIYFIIYPKYQQLGVLKIEFEKLDREVNELRVIKNNMAKFKKEYNQLQETLQQALSELPEQKDIPNILRSVSMAGGETGLKISLFEPKPQVAKEFYAELPISLKYSGSFHNVGLFFDELRKMQRIMHIPSFTLNIAKSNSSRVLLSGTCTVTTFLYLKEVPPPAGTKQPGKRRVQPTKPKGA